MSFPPRYLLSATVLAATLALVACGDDPVDPGAVAPSVTVSALASTRTQLSISGRAGDDRYIVERASGDASATFTQIGTVAASGSAAPVTYVDSVGLLADTEYRYRVAAARGTQTSGFGASQTVRTLAPGRAQAEITADITANRTLYPDTTYVLRGFIHVTNGATLTILPGTTIMGDFETVGSSLFILRGAKLNAVGTAALPIVFTSERPVGQRRPGDWGGLVMIGNGIINRTGDIAIEGTGTTTGTAPGTNYRLTYSGGTSNADDSGELRYVRVEFAGFGPALNEELNSFTFAGIGSGTKLGYLQALGGLDDSFEWFGGAVDASNLVSYEAGDDHFDMSEGYVGRLQYLIAYQDTVLPPRELAGSPSTDPQGIENDGCNGTGCTNGFDATPLTVPFVANFTLVGTGKASLSASGGGVGMVLRRGTGGYYVNGVIARYPRGAIALRDASTFARAGSATSPDLATTDLAIRNVVAVETGGVTFETGTGRFAFDLAPNAITASGATTASLFTAIPTDATGSTTAAALDWTPPAGAVSASGGLSAFSGRVQARAGTFITGTTFVGAAPAASATNARWWAGWTRYAQN